ncbi:DUF2993 domain-containing protein [Microbacterium bovistercoris]|uniref:DUF2993 domain-containing protein n=1 Tax=Microbacterium bovistercoris TaxID=2293570 RepID=A0A371NVI6_9MICO|nr:DUF2993 domain-containing protein [Microbacterium bovistercoris]REJ06601.1 DUF2993 domain-containing protein [Microbacterium bovistercoris]
MSDTSAYPTLPLPDDLAQSAPQPRRRRRWPWVVLIVAVLLAALAVTAELVARAVVPNVVRSVVVDNMGLPADQQLDVQTYGLLVPQLISGRLGRLDLSSDSVEVGGITGAVDVMATGVPIGGGAIGHAEGTVTIPEDQFAGLVEKTDLPIDDVAFDAPDVTVSGSVPVLGLSIPVALTVTPGADAGELLLTPVSATLGGIDLDIAQLADRLGGIGSGLAQTQRICIADQLPAGLTLTGLKIDADTAVADVDVDGRITVDPSLQENGTCP